MIGIFYTYTMHKFTCIFLFDICYLQGEPGTDSTIPGPKGYKGEPGIEVII